VAGLSPKRRYCGCWGRRAPLNRAGGGTPRARVTLRTLGGRAHPTMSHRDGRPSGSARVAPRGHSPGAFSFRTGGRAPRGASEVREPARPGPGLTNPPVARESHAHPPFREGQRRGPPPRPREHEPRPSPEVQRERQAGGTGPRDDARGPGGGEVGGASRRGTLGLGNPPGLLSLESELREPLGRPRERDAARSGARRGAGPRPSPGWPALGRAPCCLTARPVSAG